MRGDTVDRCKQLRRRTRREFLVDAARLGAGAAGLALLGPHAALPAFAQQGSSGERIQVLLQDLVESSDADFARGQSRGVQVVSANGRGALRGSLGGEFISGAIAIPFQATHLGLHWILPHDSPDAVAVEVRAGADGRTWSDWITLSIEAVKPIPGGQEVFAALVSGERGRFAQYRVTFQTAAAATLERITVTAINSVDGPQLSVAGTLNEPTSQSFSTLDGRSIPVVTRRGWGCDESLRFSGGKELWPEMYVPVKKFVLHHTATKNSYTDGAAEVRAIYSYHAKTQGWGDIGYNSLVDRFGNVYEGRHGRGEGSDREILSAGVVAGHVSGHNYGSTGLAAIGNSSGKGARDGWSPSPGFYSSVEDMTTLEAGRHYLDPTKRSDFLKFDGTWHNGLDNCSGHYQSTGTECPGAALKDYLSTLRSTVSRRLSGGPAPTLSETGGKPRDVSTSSLAFTWSGGEPEYYYCLEGWARHPSDPYDIVYLSGYQGVSARYSGGDPLAQEQVWVGPATETTKSFALTSPGRYTMHVRGKTGRYEASLTFNVTGVTPSDTPPTASWVSPSGGATVGGVSVPIQISASDAEDPAGSLTVQWRVDGVDPSGTWRGTSYSAPNYTAAWDTTGLSGGYILTARSTDSKGQTSSPASISVTVDNSGGGGSPAVVVSSISPSSMKSGTSVGVTIKGSGFASSATVAFENGQGSTPTATSVKVVDANTVTATVTVAKLARPLPKDRVWDVRVSSGGSSGVLPDAFTVTP
jgi:hypothetical protein